MSAPVKLTVGSTFGIYPPRGGGQLRIFNLYRHLAFRCPVDVVTLVPADEPALAREVAPGLREIRVPMSAEHAAAEAALASEAAAPVTDVAFPELHTLTPGFGRAIAGSVVPGGAVVASHPYAFDALRAAGGDCQAWYDAHNVEFDLKSSMLPRTPVGKRLLDATRAIEQACCEQAELVLASCAEDADRLSALYRVAPDRVTVVPNGVNTADIRFTSATERRRLCARLRMERPLALFIGSWHLPNALAVERILELAPRLPELTFAIVGSVGIPVCGRGIAGERRAAGGRRGRAEGGAPVGGRGRAQSCFGGLGDQHEDARLPGGRCAGCLDRGRRARARARARTRRPHRALCTASSRLSGRFWRSQRNWRMRAPSR